MSNVNICMGTTKKGSRCKRRLSYNSTGNFCTIHNININIDIPEECSICFENLTDKDSCLECGHLFHKNCVMRLHNNKCPLCRQESGLIELYQRKIRLRVSKLIEKIFYTTAVTNFIIKENNWKNNDDSRILSHMIMIKNINCCKSIITREIMNECNDSEIINIILSELNNKIIIQNYSDLFIRL